MQYLLKILRNLVAVPTSQPPSSILDSRTTLDDLRTAGRLHVALAKILGISLSCADPPWQTELDGTTPIQLLMCLLRSPALSLIAEFVSSLPILEKSKVWDLYSRAQALQDEKLPIYDIYHFFGCFIGSKDHISPKEAYQRTLRRISEFAHCALTGSIPASMQVTCLKGISTSVGFFRFGWWHGHRRE